MSLSASITKPAVVLVHLGLDDILLILGGCIGIGKRPARCSA